MIPDISHHHPVQRWSAVAQNVQAIISKATEGATYVDPTLDSFIKHCEEYHLPYWLYTYLRNGNELDQTKFLVKTCRGKVGDYFRGYILDVESGNDAKAVDKALNWLEKETGRCMLYTMWAEYSKYKEVILSRGNNVAWWEARYGLNNGKYSALFPCHKKVDLHQYSSQGTVPGIPDKIDVNRLTGLLPLSWFTDPAEPVDKTQWETYGDVFPALPGIPLRNYYKQSDGITTMRNYPTQIKRIQKLVSWITGDEITADGKYGGKTREAVIAAQKILGVAPDGVFGKDTLAAAKAYRKVV